MFDVVLRDIMKNREIISVITNVATKSTTRYKGNIKITHINMIRYLQVQIKIGSKALKAMDHICKALKFCNTFYTYLSVSSRVLFDMLTSKDDKK